MKSSSACSLAALALAAIYMCDAKEQLMRHEHNKVVELSAGGLASDLDQRGGKEKHKLEDNGEGKDGFEARIAAVVDRMARDRHFRGAVSNHLQKSGFVVSSEDELEGMLRARANMIKDTAAMHALDKTTAEKTGKLNQPSTTKCLVANVVSTTTACESATGIVGTCVTDNSHLEEGECGDAETDMIKSTWVCDNAEECQIRLVDIAKCLQGSAPASGGVAGSVLLQTCAGPDTTDGADQKWKFNSTDSTDGKILWSADPTYCLSTPGDNINVIELAPCSATGAVQLWNFQQR